MISANLTHRDLMKTTLVMAALAAIVLSAAAFSGPLQDKEGKDAPKQKPATETRAAAAKVDVPFYGNEKCPISGKDVDKTKSAEISGQLVYFCCDKCIAKAKRDDKALMEKAYPPDKV